MTAATATAEPTIAGPDLNPQPPSNLPDVAGVPTDKTAFSLAVRRMLGLEDASDGEIELFFHVCHKSGLDPFNREVYMIGRNTEVAQWEPVDAAQPDGPKRKVVRWVTKYTIQTAINGFRKRAREIADGKGIKYTQDEPLWCGEDGEWKTVWTEKTPPVAAKFTVYRDGEPYVFVAHSDEYVQTVKVDSNYVPNSMWKKMPRNQIRKCAEAGAIQAAFPDELGGLLLEDAVQDEPVVIDETGAVQEPAKQRRGGRGMGGLRDRATQAQQGDVVEGEVVTEQANPVTPERETRGSGGDTNEADTQVENTTAAADPGEEAETPEESESAIRKAARQRLENAIFAMFGDLKLNGDKNREDRLIVIRALMKLPNLTSTKELDVERLQELRNELDRRKGKGTLESDVREILNLATIAEDNAKAARA